MKKLFALVAVAAFAVAFTACGGKKAEETATADTTATTAPVVADTTAADTTATDTTAVAQ